MDLVDLHEAGVIKMRLVARRDDVWADPKNATAGGWAKKMTNKPLVRHKLIANIF